MFEPKRHWEKTVDLLDERGLLQHLNKVCELHHVTLDEICGRSHIRHIAAARHHYWFFLFMRKKISTVGIARLFGVTHTSVMNGVRNHGDTLCNDLEI